MSSSTASRIAQALAQAQAMGGQPGEPGLESPTGQRILQNLGIAAGGYGMGSMGGSLASALAQKAAPALESMGEAGAIFPEGTPPSELPEVAPGNQTGDPHALYAYQQKLGPDYPAEDYYNLFGDKNAILKTTEGKHGFGSSVRGDTLTQYGIPIIGKQAKSAVH